jgi:thymidylate kinase
MEKAELFKNSKENLEWFKENYEDLKKKYDERWIVIDNKTVVKSASTFDEILAFVRKHDPNKVIVEYMQSKQIAMFF